MTNINDLIDDIQIIIIEYMTCVIQSNKRFYSFYNKYNHLT